MISARSSRRRRISATHATGFLEVVRFVDVVVDTATARTEPSRPEWQPTSAAGFRSTREPQYSAKDSPTRSKHSERREGPCFRDVSRRH